MRTHRPGATAMRLPTSLLQLGVPPSALLGARPHISCVPLLLRPLRRVAPQQQRRRILRCIRCGILLRVRHWPPKHIVLRPIATNIPCPCTAPQRFQMRDT